MATFQERLRELRKTRKLSQTKLAAEVGISQRVISDFENGTGLPSFNVLIALADFFDVSLDYLVGRSDDPRRK
ncbi:MAG: helix-turn-helix transcriptional regulator [Bacillota bacterium]|jgi:transcriptional regulator with XRE-family HTH domain|nr:helix-turn-helix transcriptional regulator [Bacillota bacterium]